MNRSDIAKGIAWFDAIATAAKARAGRLRSQLAADARAEWEEQDTAPTWRVRDLGQVIGSITHEATVVGDEVAFAEWVARRYPTEVYTRTVVREAWQARFLDRAERTDSGQVVDPATGEVIPGLTVRPGGEFGGVSLRLEAPAKALLAQAADMGLHQIAEITGPAALHALEASDPVAA